MRIIKSKKKRLDIIKEIINTHKIDNQADLLEPLREAGIEVTQATLSRDLKQLKIAKVPDESGRYIYTLPHKDNIGRIKQYAPIKTASQTADMGGFLSITFSYNIAVVKTSPGLASSMAYDIDSGGDSEILGTVAGDDTIIIVMGEDVTHEQIYEVLAKYIPALRAY